MISQIFKNKRMENNILNVEGSEEIKLTQFSRGAGCGCKIAPKVLDEILKTNMAMPADSKLLVGNSSKDDAAVYDLGQRQCHQRCICHGR
jgi:selenide,water dikinase